jgi:cytochrome c-type biogenesis protein CcmF
MGTEQILILLFVFFSGFSLVANFMVGYEVYMGNPKFVGGSIAHIGIALLFIGFVTSERYNQKETIPLEKDKTVEAMGYKMTYVKDEKVGKFDAFRVQVERNGRTHIVSPTMYYSDFTQSVMRHPDLINYLNRDLYVAPLSLEDPKATDDRTITLQKGESTDVGPLKLKFDDFDFSAVQMGQMLEGKAFQIKGVVEIQDGSKKSKLDLIMKNDGQGPEFLPVNYVTPSGEKYILQMVRLMPDKEDRAKSKMEFSIKMPLSATEMPHQETLVVEASIKPYINLVWMGTITLAIGFFMTILRRVDEARLKVKEPD